MPSLSILLLGNANRAEFRDARPSLEQWGTVYTLPDVAAAASLLAEGQLVPDVIVVAQAFPGQFSHATIERLRRLAPLAPVVGLLGSWCEGEMRSGRPWPAAVRTYWHQWPARSDRQLRRMARGECCAWTLPATATEEERLLADAQSSPHTPCAQSIPHTPCAQSSPHTPCADIVEAASCRFRAVCEHPAVPETRQDAASPPGPHTPCADYVERGLVLIHAQSREMARWLSAVCRSRGFATVWQQTATAARVEGARVGIFDATELSEDYGSRLQRLAAAIQPAPVIVLLSYPRAEDHRRALAAGAAAVLSKPLSVDDLLWELEKTEGGGSVFAGPQNHVA